MEIDVHFYHRSRYVSEDCNKIFHTTKRIRFYRPVGNVYTGGVMSHARTSCHLERVKLTNYISTTLLSKQFRKFKDYK